MTSLIHVTSKTHKHQIILSGLAPMTQTPKSGNRLYVVEKALLPWVVEHVMKRHGLKLDDLVVFPVPRWAFATFKRYNRGVWYTQGFVRVTNWYTVREYLAKHPGITLQSPEFWDTLL